MTQEYAQSGAFLFGSAVSASAQEPYEPETWTDITARCNAAGMKIIPQAKVLALRITDLRCGWGQQDDKIKASLGGANVCYRRHLLLSPLITQTTLGTAMNNAAMFYADVTSGPGSAASDGALLMGGGSAGASGAFSVFEETSASDPTPTNASSIANTDKVVSISPLYGKPGAAYVVVYGYDNGRVAKAYIQGDGAAGASAVMHANTANCWGVLVSNINATTPGTGSLLIYAGTSIYTLSLSAAIADAPTPALTDIPGGGTALGIDALQKNYLNRAYWMWPKVSQASTTALGTHATFDVVSTNLEGTGPEKIPTTLTRVIGGVLWNHQVIRWDGTRLTRFDGETETDMQVMKGRESNSDYRWVISNVIRNGGELYVVIGREDLTQTAGTLGGGELHIEKYIADGVYAYYAGPIGAFYSNAGSVSTALGRETISGEIDYMHQHSMGIPISKQTGFAHMNMYNSTKWDRVWFPPEGVNPFLHFNKTGSGNEIAQQWASGGFSGTFLSNKFPIPGYHGLPAVAVGCSASEMNIAAGGTDATIIMYWLQQTGQTHTDTGEMQETFNATDPLEKQTRFWLDNSSAFTLGQFRITLVRGADTYKTSNGLPATYYVMVFLDGKVRTPRDAGFTAQEGWLA